MDRKTKTPKVAGFMRVVVGANVARLMDHHYAHLGNTTKRVHALAKDAGIGHGTVQRVIHPKVGASLDTIESLANALQVSVYQLMLPSLDVRNPQVVKGATEEEKRMYMRWKSGKPIEPSHAKQENE